MPFAYAVALCWISGFVGVGVIALIGHIISTFINRYKSGWYKK